MRESGECNLTSDNNSEMRKKFMAVAVDCLGSLRQASDAGEPLTPYLIGQVREVIAKAVELVHYGFHPRLNDEERT